MTRIAGISLIALLGFALAGGYALQAHGLVQRISEDVDLFTDLWDMHTSESRVVDLDSLFV